MHDPALQAVDLEQPVMGELLHLPGRLQSRFRRSGKHCPALFAVGEQRTAAGLVHIEQGAGLESGAIRALEFGLLGPDDQVVLAVVIEAAAGVVGKLTLEQVDLGVGLNALALGGGQIVAGLAVIPLQLTDAGILLGVAVLQALNLLPELADSIYSASGRDHLLGRR